ncbi:hypothetical protein ES703_23691 [subsurface metagenome]
MRTTYDIYLNFPDSATEDAEKIITIKDPATVVLKVRPLDGLN